MNHNAPVCKDHQSVRLLQLKSNSLVVARINSNDYMYRGYFIFRNLKVNSGIYGSYVLVYNETIKRRFCNLVNIKNYIDKLYINKPK
jgi:hypothetical protein